MFSVPDNKQETSATISAANHLLTERIEEAVEIKRWAKEKKQDKLRALSFFSEVNISCFGN